MHGLPHKGKRVEISIKRERYAMLSLRMQALESIGITPMKNQRLKLKPQRFC